MRWATLEPKCIKVDMIPTPWDLHPRNPPKGGEGGVKRGRVAWERGERGEVRGSPPGNGRTPTNIHAVDLPIRPHHGLAYICS